MAEAGKGSRHRPVNKEAFEAGWDRIFGGVSSPCVDVCDMDYAANICRGCYRTMDEISAWGFSNEDEKQRILKNTEERKQHAKSNHT